MSAEMGPFKFWRTVHRFFFGIPDSEEAPCMYCKAPVPPFQGVRDNVGATCDDECSRFWMERSA